MRKQQPIHEVLPIGTKIFVRHLRQSEVEYDSYLVNVDSGEISIAIPTKKGEPMKVYKSIAVLIYAYLPIGKLSFQTTVEGISSAEGYALTLAIPERYEIAQSRQYFRVPTFFDVKVYHGSLSELKALPFDGPEPLFEQATVDNISGGGCRIATNMLIHQRDFVVLDFENSVVENVHMLEALVIKVTVPDKQRRFVNLRFENIEESVRTNIIRYVFRRELELRQLR
ncbi:MAG: PilZ domain-containing protein [Deferribacteraceae bacterium]|jgi:c-di-GMP-binding flagellar brake protein YcgR|nr:PilZ domain-containing protein [Deferribacteraceae bacterium]